MFKVLVTARSFGKYSEEAIELLKKNGCEIYFSEKTHLQSDELAQMIKGYDALIVGIDQVTRNVIENSDKLKVICMHGTGLDHIDVEAASEKGIYVGNAPGCNNNAVAELTVGLMLDAARHISEMDRKIRNNSWETRMGVELSGKTLGLIGLGSIGKRVVELLQGFKMKFLAYDQVQDFDYAKKMDVRYVDLETLLRNSDFISLHIPLTEETKGLISTNELGMMKKNAILINTSRGALVDEEALYQVLKEGKIAGAALDAFVHEPLEENSKLRELENIIFTPHAGASTYESNIKVDLTNARTIIGVLKGKEYYNIVNQDKVNRNLLSKFLQNR